MSVWVISAAIYGSDSSEVVMLSTPTGSLSIEMDGRASLSAPVARNRLLAAQELAVDHVQGGTSESS